MRPTCHPSLAITVSRTTAFPSQRSLLQKQFAAIIAVAHFRLLLLGLMRGTFSKDALRKTIS
jgi:hypothetical protein